MRAFGAQSMVAPLGEVVVKRPGAAFGAAFSDYRHGFRHALDLKRAQREHDALCSILAGLGVAVHQLDTDDAGPDLVYTFDPLLVSDRGAIPLRSGKQTRRGEQITMERWMTQRGIPTVGRIEGPGPRCLTRPVLRGPFPSEAAENRRSAVPLPSPAG